MTNSVIDIDSQDTTQKMDTTIKPERTPLMDIKNGKATLRQKLVSFERMSETMQEIVNFRELLQQRLEKKTGPLDKISEGYLPLIAKLVHESDKTLTMLAKHIQSLLQPEEADDDEEVQEIIPDILPLTVVEDAVTSIANRVNYGVDWVEKPPANLCVWRWELNEKYKSWLPKNGMEKFVTRIAERRQAQDDLRTLIESMPDTERDSLLKTSKKGKGDKLTTFVTPAKSKKAEDKNTLTNESKPKNDNSKVMKSTVPPNGEGDSNSTPSRTKKPVDPEREAKEKEKAEKKAARAEKERKDQAAQNKSRSLMSAFFKNPKASKPQQTIKAKTATPPVNTSAIASTSGNDFSRAFRPFTVRKDAILAPINRFQQKRDVIVIDAAPCPIDFDEDIEMLDAYAEQNPRDMLRSIVKELVRKRPHFCPLPNLKSVPKYCVRNIMSGLSEAEVMGDTSTVRHLSKLLDSRVHIPAKVLIFHEDTRPGYFGTFTKSSASVGPRNPFAKDAIVFDYSYDSGEDWEEEEGGEDLISVDGSADDEASEVGSELDDWLVDDDDDVDPGTPLSERDGSPSQLLPDFPPPSNGKRKSNTKEKKEPKKRKVIPLVAFAKGPFLEQTIGKCEYEPFNEYRIQLFNDTPFPIDPFTYVAPVVKETSAKTNIPNQLMFAVPALPAHVQQETTPETSSTPTVPSKRKQTVVKTPFPDTLLPVLTEKIGNLSSGNLTWLIETVYQELRTHPATAPNGTPSLKVTKAAVEAKVREISEKCRVKKVWIVKEDILKAISMQVGSA